MRDSRSGLLPGQTPRWVGKLVWAGAWLAFTAGGCASEVNTLEPAADNGGSDQVAGSGGKASGGSSSSTGGTAAGSAAVAGAGGAPVSMAFGGTGTTGGKTSGGASGAAGVAGQAQGGAAGAGGTSSTAGTKNGGAAGQGGTGGAAQGGTTSGGTGTAGSGGSSNLACLASWKGDKCDTCSTQVQGDKLACVDILNCYAANSCGPATCGGNADKCGANNIGKGTAGYPVAQQVYDCLCK